MIYPMMGSMAGNRPKCVLLSVFHGKRVELALVIRNGVSEAKHWLASFCSLTHYPPKILDNPADKRLP